MSKDDLKYCVTAFIDLLGFGSHLEIGSNDLRTNIGKEAINRLQNLVDAIDLMKNEKNECKSEYPANFYYKRLNDALILTIDLPEFLKPTIGRSIKKGMSGDEFDKYFDIDDYENEEEFYEDYDKKITEDTKDLTKFIGLIARLHNYINTKEDEDYFPGVKTVIATGYRKPFFPDDEEDHFSANFSFSNAYLAESDLHGSNFFMDTNISQLLYANEFARNILRGAIFKSKESDFDPLEEYEDVLYLPTKLEKTKKKEIELFRKRFYFKEYNSTVLGYLQIIDRLEDYLNGKKQPVGKKIYNSIFKAIKNGPDLEKISEDKLNRNPFTFFSTSISSDIRIFPQMIKNGESEILEEKVQNQFNRIDLLDDV